MKYVLDTKGNPLEDTCKTCGKRFKVFIVKVGDREFASLDCLDHYPSVEGFMVREFGRG